LATYPAASRFFVDLFRKPLAAADPPAPEKMPVKVFGSPASAEVARVLTCLFEKDVEFQLIRVDSFRGSQRMPQYLKLQVIYFCKNHSVLERTLNKNSVHF
jgi:hypothetical protein